MQHDVTHELKEIARIKGKTLEEILQVYDKTHPDMIDHMTDEDGKDIYFVRNRRSERVILDRYNRLALNEERFKGYRWKSLSDGWYVAGDFTDLKEGDSIIVIKASGQKQEKEIVSFITVDGEKYARVRNA